MKKLFALLFTVLLAVSLVGCSDDDSDDFDSYEYKGDEQIEVNNNDDRNVIIVDDEDDDYEDDEWEDD
jgi:uncharacterized lipoprotein YehR (DUF1307 family)